MATTTTVAAIPDMNIPPSSIRFIVCVTSAVVYGIGLLALLIAFCNHKYPLLKAKHLPLLTISHIGAISWNIGFLHASEFLVLPPSWELCALWDVWVQWVFGVMLLSGVLILRLYSLYRVFVQRKSAATRELGIISAYYYTPIIICAIVFTILPRFGSWYNPTLRKCKISSIYHGTAFGIVLLALLGLGWLTYKLRGIRRSFNEFKELRIGFFLVLTVFSINAILIMTRFSQSLISRCLLAALNVLAGNLYFWLTLGRPLYGCLFRRQHYLNKFLHTLALDGVYTEDLCISDGAGGGAGGGAANFNHLRRPPSYHGYVEEDDSKATDCPTKQQCASQQSSQVVTSSYNHMPMPKISKPANIVVPTPTKHADLHSITANTRSEDRTPLNQERRYEPVRSRSARSNNCTSSSDRHMSHDDSIRDKHVSRDWAISPVLSSPRQMASWSVDESCPALNLSELRQILVDPERTRSTDNTPPWYNQHHHRDNLSIALNSNQSTHLSISPTLQENSTNNDNDNDNYQHNEQDDITIYSATSYQSHLADASKMSYEARNTHDDEFTSGQGCQQLDHETTAAWQALSVASQPLHQQVSVTPIQTGQLTQHSISPPRSPRFPSSPRIPPSIVVLPLTRSEMASSERHRTRSPLARPLGSPALSSGRNSPMMNQHQDNTDRHNSHRRTSSAASRQMRFI